jgi:hypothetical protein
MAYYKLRLDVWCDWDPEDCDLEEIAQNISAGDAICTKRKVIAVVDRPQDIEPCRGSSRAESLRPPNKADSLLRFRLITPFRRCQF